VKPKDRLIVVVLLSNNLPACRPKGFLARAARGAHHSGSIAVEFRTPGSLAAQIVPSSNQVTCIYLIIMSITYEEKVERAQSNRIRENNGLELTLSGNFPILVPPNF